MPETCVVGTMFQARERFGRTWRSLLGGIAMDNQNRFKAAPQTRGARPNTGLIAPLAIGIGLIVAGLVSAVNESADSASGASTVSSTTSTTGQGGNSPVPSTGRP
jgi:hypothetical protein